MPRPKRKNSIDGQFAPRLIEMLRSSAFKVLSLSARRLLDRLEIELANHGGTNNGRLIVTYNDFEAYGIDRQAIGPAMREAITLGFVEVTERGRPSESDFGRHPNKFRLTYRDGSVQDSWSKPTNEWRAFRSPAGALEAQKIARKAKDPSAVAASLRRREKSFPGGGGTAKSGGQIHPDQAAQPAMENHPADQGWQPHTTLDISGKGRAA